MSTLPGTPLFSPSNSVAVASQIRHARPVVAEFLSLGEIAPSAQGLTDGDKVGEIDHGFGEAQGVTL